MVIDPDECIDCSLCQPECPAQAIVSEDDIDSEQEKFIDLNAQLADQWRHRKLTKSNPRCQKPKIGMVYRIK